MRYFQNKRINQKKFTPSYYIQKGEFDFKSRKYPIGCDTPGHTQQEVETSHRHKGILRPGVLLGTQQTV